MKKLLFHLHFILAGLLLLDSCASHQVPFSEGDFSRFGGPGSGSVTGQAFVSTTDGNSLGVLNHATVHLMPANAYTQEIAEKTYTHRIKLAEPDARFAKYVRQTPTDASGNFVFREVPPGDYYVSCFAEFRYPTYSVDENGASIPVNADDDQWIFQRISVGNGATVNIRSWQQGDDNKMGLPWR